MGNSQDGIGNRLTYWIQNLLTRAESLVTILFMTLDQWIERSSHVLAKARDAEQNLKHLAFIALDEGFPREAYRLLRIACRMMPVAERYVGSLE